MCEKMSSPETAKRSCVKMAYEAGAYAGSYAYDC